MVGLRGKLICRPALLCLRRIAMQVTCPDNVCELGVARVPAHGKLCILQRAGIEPMAEGLGRVGGVCMPSTKLVRRRQCAQGHEIVVVIDGVGERERMAVFVIDGPARIPSALLSHYASLYTRLL